MCDVLKYHDVITAEILGWKYQVRKKFNVLVYALTI